jgi:hypothetical protein
VHVQLCAALVVVDPRYRVPGLTGVLSEAAMLSKCANPNCSALFRYLHQGKVFNLEPMPARPVAGAHGEFLLQHKIEHFWLCAQCASTMTLAVEQGQVVTRPLRPSQAQESAAAAGASGSGNHKQS